LVDYIGRMLDRVASVPIDHGPAVVEAVRNAVKAGANVTVFASTLTEADRNARMFATALTTFRIILPIPLQT